MVSGVYVLERYTWWWWYGSGICMGGHGCICGGGYISCGCTIRVGSGMWYWRYMCMGGAVEWVVTAV